MAFALGDLVIDRIVSGVAENSSHELLYTLTNLQEATIDITADSVDAVDGTGTVIKTFYRGKQGEFTATNSTISLPIINAMSGNEKSDQASAQNVITMPIILTTTLKTGILIPGYTTTDISAAHMVVYKIAENGTLGDVISPSNVTVTAKAEDADWSTIAITGTTDADKMFIIKYDRPVSSNGIRIVNRSDKFPKTVKLTLKVLICDPCQPDVIRAAYLVLPSFQPSAEISFSLSTDATIDFSGKLQTSYCGTEKVLYEIFCCADDEEDAA